MRVWLENEYTCPFEEFLGKLDKKETFCSLSPENAVTTNSRAMYQGVKIGRTIGSRRLCKLSVFNYTIFAGKSPLG